MEAFQTSGGTSTLPETFAGRVRELDYKTIRYPGHCERFKLLVDLGLCASDEVEIDGARVTPRRLLGEMLYRHLPADEPDVVLVRLEFVGELEAVETSHTTPSASRPHSEDSATRLRYDIIDRFDPRTGLSAMQRTTAFPASIIAQTMARNLTTLKGAVPQERCVPAAAFIEALAARDIKVSETVF